LVPNPPYFGAQAELFRKSDEVLAFWAIAYDHEVRLRIVTEQQLESPEQHIDSFP
jgi:hypothetical protein